MLVNAFLEASAERSPAKEALVCQGARLTFAQIETSANSLANALAEIGLKRRDRAAIHLENSVQSVVSLFAILKAGGVFVIVNPQVKAGKLAYIVNDCGARALITDSRHFQEAGESLAQCTSLRAVILTNFDRFEPCETQHSSMPVFSYDTLLAQSSTDRPACPSIDVDLASLIYTSGSTGNPKGVMLTHLNMVTAANSITQYLENTADDTIINSLPLAFDYGLYQVLMAMKFGGKVVLENGFVFPQQVIDLVVRERVTGWPMVPTIVAILLKLKNLDRYDFSTLRYITNTAQALPPRHISRLMEIFPGVRIYSMYGLTECKRVSYMPPEELARRPASVGKAMPNSEIWIVDEDGNEITTPRTPGELVVRGAHVMKGYWNLPEDTARALRPGLYPGEYVLYTGDLFETDEDGYLYFLGRRDDMIKTAGERVSPKEIENALCEMSEVIEAAVIGVEDDILGQAIKAFVVPADGSIVGEKDVIRFCAGRLEGFMVPKSVEFRAELPRTATGKVRKNELRQMNG